MTKHMCRGLQRVLWRSWVRISNLGITLTLKLGSRYTGCPIQMAASVGVVLPSATYSLQKATIYPISHTSAFKPTNAAGVLFFSSLCFLLKDLESFMHHYKSRCSLNRTKKDIWISNTRFFSSKMVLRIIHVLTMNAQPSKWEFFFFPVLSKKNLINGLQRMESLWPRVMAGNFEEKISSWTQSYKKILT